jgi:hypothetical protein
MRMRMRILRSLRKLVIAYTKNEIKTTLRLAHRTKNP